MTSTPSSSRTAIPTTSTRGRSRRTAGRGDRRRPARARPARRLARWTARWSRSSPASGSRIGPGRGRGRARPATGSRRARRGRSRSATSSRRPASPSVYFAGDTGPVPGPRPPRRPRRPRAAPGLDVGAAPRARAPRPAIGGRRCSARLGATGCRADPLGHALPAPPVASLGPAASPAGGAVRGPRRRTSRRAADVRVLQPGASRRVRRSRRRSPRPAAARLGGRLDR